jgi:plastocyanin
MVPLLVQEMQGTLPFLSQEFASGGLLDGKEVFAFYPSTLVVYQGETIQIALTNASADDHTFTAPDLDVNVSIKEQSSATTSFVASKPGVFTFVCSVPEHTPYMRGEILVLPR